MKKYSNVIYIPGTEVLGDDGFFVNSFQINWKL